MTYFTTMQAADRLNISYSYLCKLLDDDEIPYEKRERHRYIKDKDLYAYKKKRDAIREEALEELARLDNALI